jgi:hypothetical protein
MKTRSIIWMSVALASIALSGNAQSQSAPSVSVAQSEVYVQQSHGFVAPGTNAPAKPPEAATAASPSAAPTAPDTCNAQNASSQACHTATQQTRPAGR